MNPVEERTQHVLAFSRDLASLHRLGLAELVSSVARDRFPGLEAAVLRAVARGLLEDGEAHLARRAEKLAARFEQGAQP